MSASAIAKFPSSRWELWQSRVAFGPRNPRVASVSGYMTYCAAAAEQDGVLLSGLLQGPMEGPSFAVKWNVLLLQSVKIHLRQLGS